GTPAVDDQRESAQVQIRTGSPRPRTVCSPRSRNEASRSAASVVAHADRGDERVADLGWAGGGAAIEEIDDQVLHRISALRSPLPDHDRSWPGPDIRRTQWNPQKPFGARSGWQVPPYFSVL